MQVQATRHHMVLITISTGEYCGITEASETDDDGAIKDFTGIIRDYEDIVQEEKQLLFDLVREFQDNAYISEVEELKDKLKQIQIGLPWVIGKKTR